MPVSVADAALITMVWPSLDWFGSRRIATTFGATPVPLSSSTYVAGVGSSVSANVPTAPFVGVIVAAFLSFTVVDTRMSPSGLPSVSTTVPLMVPADAARLIGFAART